MLLVNGRVFYEGGFRENLKVRIGSGEIRETGENLRAMRGEPVTDLEGDFLLPGFVDIHIHGFHGYDAMKGEENVRGMSRELYREGVAAFCPTTVSADETDTRRAVVAMQAVMENQEEKGARVLGVHLEAPFLQEEKAGAQRSEFFADPDWEWLERVTSNHPETVKLITAAPERAGSEAFIRRAAKRGIHVSVGHTSAGAETVHLAADWGADHATHLFNAMSPLHHRSPGAAGAALTDERFTCEIICDGIHLHPDIIRLTLLCKGMKRTAAITDAMEAAGMPDGQYSLGGLRVNVKNGEARLPDGTIAGSALTMSQTLENLINRFGISPEEACAICTSTPAESVGEHTAGTMKKGSPLPLTRWGSDWKFKGIIG